MGYASRGCVVGPKPDPYRQRQDLATQELYWTDLADAIGAATAEVERQFLAMQVSRQRGVEGLALRVQLAKLSQESL